MTNYRSFAFGVASGGIVGVMFFGSGLFAADVPFAKPAQQQPSLSIVCNENVPTVLAGKESYETLLKAAILNAKSEGYKSPQLMMKEIMKASYTEYMEQHKIKESYKTMGIPYPSSLPKDREPTKQQIQAEIDRLKQYPPHPLILHTIKSYEGALELAPDD